MITIYNHILGSGLLQETYSQAAPPIHQGHIHVEWNKTFWIHMNVDTSTNVVYDIKQLLNQKVTVRSLYTPKPKQERVYYVGHTSRVKDGWIMASFDPSLEFDFQILEIDQDELYKHIANAMKSQRLLQMLSIRFDELCGFRQAHGVHMEPITIKFIDNIGIYVQKAVEGLKHEEDLSDCTVHLEKATKLLKSLSYRYPDTARAIEYAMSLRSAAKRGQNIIEMIQSNKAYSPIVNMSRVARTLTKDLVVTREVADDNHYDSVLPQITGSSVTAGSWIGTICANHYLHIIYTIQTAYISDLVKEGWHESIAKQKAMQKCTSHFQDWHNRIQDLCTKYVVNPESAIDFLNSLQRFNSKLINPLDMMVRFLRKDLCSHIVGMLQRYKPDPTNTEQYTVLPMREIRLIPGKQDKMIMKLDRLMINQKTIWKNQIGIIARLAHSITKGEHVDCDLRTYRKGGTSGILVVSQGDDIIINDIQVNAEQLLGFINSHIEVQDVRDN